MGYEGPSRFNQANSLDDTSHFRYRARSDCGPLLWTGDFLPSLYFLDFGIKQKLKNQTKDIKI